MRCLVIAVFLAVMAITAADQIRCRAYGWATFTTIGTLLALVIVTVRE